MFVWNLRNFQLNLCRTLHFVGRDSDLLPCFSSRIDVLHLGIMEDRRPMRLIIEMTTLYEVKQIDA